VPSGLAASGKIPTDNACVEWRALGSLAPQHDPTELRCYDWSVLQDRSDVVLRDFVNHCVRQRPDPERANRPVHRQPGAILLDHDLVAAGRHLVQDATAPELPTTAAGPSAGAFVNPPRYSASF
jgi:hypothetical protein